MVFSSQMAQQNSFDIVSQVDAAEITNALNQTIKEVRQRFDFKGSSANVVHEKNELVLSAEDETKLRNMNDILQQKLVRRGVPLKSKRCPTSFVVWLIAFVTSARSTCDTMSNEFCCAMLFADLPAEDITKVRACESVL